MTDKKNTTTLVEIPIKAKMFEVVANDGKISLAKALSEAKLVVSKSEARRLIYQGGVKLDGEKGTREWNLEIDKRYHIEVGINNVRKAYVTPVEPVEPEEPEESE